MGYIPIEITRADVNKALLLKIFNEQFIHSILVIVDETTHGQGIITEVKALQYMLFSDESQHRPILSIVDSGKTNKETFYELGVFDYISSPLITAELNRRVSYAESYFNSIQKVLKAVETERAKPLINPSLATLAENTTQYLHSRLDQNITFSELIVTMGTNRNKLNEAFKTCYGMTVFSWLLKQRMSLAATLLKTTTMSVLQVAEQVGYPDSNNFSTAFKREFKLSPRSYRQMKG